MLGSENFNTGKGGNSLTFFCCTNIPLMRAFFEYDIISLDTQFIITIKGTIKGDVYYIQKFNFTTKVLII